MKFNKSYLIIVASIVVLGLFLGCAEHPAQQGSGLMGLDANKPLSSDGNSNVYNNLTQFQTVKVGDKIEVNYTGRFTDGSIFDSSVGKTPLAVTVGTTSLIKGFTNALIGMKVGETKTVTILPEDAYGTVTPSGFIMTVDANQVKDFNLFTVGASVSNGTSNGVVTSKTDKNMTVNFYPYYNMLGKTLIFELTLVSIK
ncbi:MAG: FKBP-type peptidyl-prolyl cis-trans isomerase [archaeon]|jgi:FKBP-type peptidyl-prolyl cis-trans isomerase 2